MESSRKTDWTLFLMTVAVIVLVFVDGELRVISSATIVVSLLLLLVGVVMSLSLLKMLRADRKVPRS